MKPKSTLRHFLALAASSLLAISSASALTYYWDNNGTDAGFGSADGTTWADTGSTLLNLDNTGGGAGSPVVGTNIITTTADRVDFGRTGAGNPGLLGGTVTISGTVNIDTIGGGNPSGNQTITFSGGTINFDATGNFTMGNGVHFTVDSLITGASTSLTKDNINTTVRLNNADNSYTGSTNFSGGLQVAFLTDGGLNSSIGASSSAASNLQIGLSNRACTLSYVGATNASTDRLFTIANANGTSLQNVTLQSSGTGTLQFTNTGTLAVFGSSTPRNFILGGSNTGENILNPLIADGAGTSVVSVTKADAGNWILANNSNSYTGTTTLSGGTLTVSKMANYGTVSPIGQGTAGVGITFSNGTLLYNGTGDNTNRLVQASAGNGSILNYGSGALNFTETGFFNVQGSTTSSRTLFLGGTNGGTISGIIRNNTGTGAAFNVGKTGNGTWTLAGQNTYTGTTDLQSGTLEFKSGDSNITQTLGSLRNRIGETTLVSNKTGSGSLSTIFSSYIRDVTGASVGGTGNIVTQGGTYGTDNSVIITGTAGFIDRGLFFNGSEYASGSGTGLVRALDYGSDASTAAVDTITASNHVKLTATPGSSQDTITLLSLNLQGDGVNWTNNSDQTLTVPGILKSGGGSSTISGGNVNGGADAELVVRTDLATDNLTIDSVLNLGNTSGFLTKSGEGKLTLTGANTYQGQTHINAGTLSISSNGNLGGGTTPGTLNIKGGTLQATSTFSLTDGTNNRAVTLLNQSNIEVTGTNTLTIAGVVSTNALAGTAPAGFNKTGTGTLQLSGLNTYNGATVVAAGTLAITGATQATNSITFNGGSLGLDTGVSVTATRAAVDLTNGTIKVTGSTGATSYTLLTAASITGTPVLAEAVSGYALQIVDGAADELRLVKTGGGSPYDTWSGNQPFDGDLNNDGVSNGLAFLLGASGPNVSALDKLPAATQTGGNLKLTFDMLPAAARGGAQLFVEHSADLGTWSTGVLVPDASGGTAPVTFIVNDSAPGDPLNPLDVEVTISSDEADGGKLFGRLKAVNP